MTTKIVSKLLTICVICAAMSGVAMAQELHVGSGETYTTIHDAVNAANSGDTIYVHNGTYYEGDGISITKDRITLQGEDANTTTIHGRWTTENVVYVSGDYVNISGLMMTGSAAYGRGIDVSADNCIISDNIVSLNSYGIRLDSSNNCMILGNIVNSSTERGIQLYHSNNCTLKSNNANPSNGCGIHLEHSNNNTLTNNNASNNGVGIMLERAEDNNITCNDVNSNQNGYGIGMFYSSNNTLHDNNCNLNNDVNSYQNGYGIILRDSINNILSNSTISNNYNGIHLDSSSNNLIMGNNISLSSHNNIYLQSTSVYNTIKENTILGYGCGVYLEYSGDNEIYHNNFINNENLQVYDHYGFNEWDKGPIIGGNYWSDHVCHGNPSDGTEPYTGIDTNVDAIDNYPFEEANGWITVVEEDKIPGDVNNDDIINIQDAVLLFNWVSFSNERGTTYIVDPDNADVNDDDTINIQDAVLLFNWVSFPNERGTTYILV